MEKIKQVMQILEDLKVKDIVGYDFEGASPFYDYFVIGTVNDRQAAAVANKIKADKTLNLKSVEGKGSGWLLIDLHDVIIHLFKDAERNFYDFDRRLIGIKQV